MEEVKKTRAEEAGELREAIMAEARGMTEEQRKMFILFLEAIVGGDHFADVGKMV